jgi:hypothetical protein
MTARMGDQLEDFIRSNRPAFDDRRPLDRVWEGVSFALGFKQKNTWWNSVVLWRAAAIVFMVLSVYLLIPKPVKSPRSQIVMKEFNDVEAFYTRQISEKVALIDELQKNEGSECFTQEFQQLEAMYMVLKEEMKTRPSKKVKDALVLNLLVRIDLLNQQLQKLEEVYTEEKPAKKESNT